MNKILSGLAIAVVLAMAGCASSTQEAGVQRPGEATHSGLQVPPDAGERPVQTAAEPRR